MVNRISPLLDTTQKVLIAFVPVFQVEADQSVKLYVFKDKGSNHSLVRFPVTVLMQGPEGDGILVFDEQAFA